MAKLNRLPGSGSFVLLQYVPSQSFLRAIAKLIIQGKLEIK